MARRTSSQQYSKDLLRNHSSAGQSFKFSIIISLYFSKRNGSAYSTSVMVMKCATSFSVNLYLVLLFTILQTSPDGVLPTMFSTEEPALGWMLHPFKTTLWGINCVSKRVISKSIECLNSGARKYERVIVITIILINDVNFRISFNLVNGYKYSSFGR